MFKTSPEGKYYWLLFPGKDTEKILKLREVKGAAQSHTELQSRGLSFCWRPMILGTGMMGYNVLDMSTQQRFYLLAI